MNRNTPHRLAVILIDMQDFFLKNFNPEVRKVLVSNQLKVLEACQKRNVPVIVLEYKAGGELRGATTLELRKKVEHIKTAIIIKDSNSGFTDTNLDEILRGMQCKKLVLMGINANGCVQDTAMSALRRGYSVITARGLIASARSDGRHFSKKNEEWYEQETVFLDGVGEVLEKMN